MTTTMISRQDSLSLISQLADERIENHRLMMSRREGRGVEMIEAAEEWMRDRFPEWKSQQWLIAIDQACGFRLCCPIPNQDWNVG